MRAPLLLVPLLLATLAGCIEAEPDPAPGDRGGPAGEPAGPFLVVHASSQDPGGEKWWVFAVRTNGTAERLQYVDDRSAAIRVGEGIDYSLEDARFLLEPRGGNQNRSAGGVIVFLERGVVPPPAMEALRAALAAWPSVPGGSLDSAGNEDVVRFREGGVDVLRFPPARPEHRPLLLALRAAQEAFETREVQQSPEAPQYRPPGPDACPRLSVEVSREAIVPGEVVLVNATLENCGATPLTVGQDACGPFPAWHVDVAFPGRVRSLRPGPSARVPDPVCAREPDPITIPPGEKATLVRRWDGTLTECAEPEACRAEDAPGGEATVVTYLSGQEHSAGAPVLVVPREGERTRLLLVKEHDWVNTTAEEPVMGHFGPHCAPARYTLDPPSVTLRVYGGEGNFSVRPAVLVRDFRGAAHPGNVVTVSADRLDYAWADGNATLASPFDPALPLAEVVADGDDFLVNGTRVPPGGTFTLRSEATLVKPRGTYEVASVLVFRNVGPAAVVTERVGGCM